ncbi:M20/M25/M40 family metallo-hydrolase [Spirilliplanes yamanashiensis]|uniref:Aminopeptidase n=1 Tax=Spirilliplanes yamanashiensis TaxID=42233 RepID=A0A8J3Y790_9ACTN|nr:M20/M25/M40 family metallo-hydrolase [Spirilliplanes yamanashiensis]MDP9815066.1 Zn-dependent M28 family amino/carboxypeptidase [Spirilliplanes yamanashiensis]GIJ02722.1 aminopeptidase [Spirilliplanes yamanashiensis]
MGAWRRVAGVAVVVLAGAVTAAPGRAEPVTSAGLRDAVTPAGMTRHLVALQGIADRHGGSRVAGRPGYEASVAYAAGVLEQSGYRVTRQDFEVATFLPLGPSAVTGPDGAVEHSVLAYSGSGDAEAAATVPVGDGRGCAAADFGPANAATVVILDRGGCSFADKATRAELAGAAAVVVRNDGAGALTGTLGTGFTGGIPVVGVAGDAAQVAAGTVLRVVVNAERGRATSANLLAETRGGDPGTVVMVGAHLDSVAEGPGVNDNATGVAAVLEIAAALARQVPRNTVRFALWGAEESGLLGAEHYVAGLPDAERRRVALYLNVDMIGSPNFGRFVYDGDGSAYPGAAPAGSAAIERLFRDHFAAEGLAAGESAMDGRSDYGPFTAAGIPAGGLFTGAEGIKSAAQAVQYGGTAGAPFDPCYHRACDGLANVNMRALDEMADALAHAVAVYAQDASAVAAPEVAAVSRR